MSKTNRTRKDIPSVTIEDGTDIVGYVEILEDEEVVKKPIDWENTVIDADAPLTDYGPDLPSEPEVSAESIYNIFETNEDLEENGKWFTVKGDAKIRLRRFTSTKSINVRARIDRAWREANGKKKPSDEDHIIMLNRQLADGVVVDWKNFMDRDGQPIEFSPQAAFKLLTAMPNLQNAISIVTLDMDNFKAEEREEVVKNF